VNAGLSRHWRRLTTDCGAIDVITTARRPGVHGSDARLTMRAVRTTGMAGRCAQKHRLTIDASTVCSDHTRMSELQ